MSEKKTRERLLVCNCQKSMDIDAAALGKALDPGGPLQLRTELCRGEIGVFEAALASGEPLHVACTQEAPLFREIAEEKAGEEAQLRFTNIRERAGWCSASADTVPKIAALLAEAAYDAKPAGVTTLNSDGVCLVYGAGQGALDVASDLAGRLSVSVLLSDASDTMAPATVSVPINKGRIAKASGHLGAYEIEIDGFAEMLPSSRAALDFIMPRDGVRSACDVIFDMSGGSPLFSAHAHRDGYFRVDPDYPAAIAKAMFEIAEFVGEFEKPLYVSYEPGICAHARSGQIGCTNCLDNCPTGAITPDGDHVRIDSAICGGCGNCSAVCPTGAVSYAYPMRADLIARAQLLLRTYLGAGGKRPALLLHDESHGSGLIGAMARYGRGLPPNLLPLSVYSVFQIGHEALAAMLSSGGEHVVILAPDKPGDLPALKQQTTLTEAFLAGLGHEGPRIHICEASDPDVVETLLYALPELKAMEPGTFDPVGTKRDIARAAFAKLHKAAAEPPDIIELPDTAPYGRIDVDAKACTLCLACVGACPVGALGDSPERPELSIAEATCVQCGVCVATCPESAITLVPRYNFLPAALSQDILMSDEPFECLRCGKSIGSKSSVEKIVKSLKGHSMFKNEDQLRLIQMCDDCRVITMATSNDDPFVGGDRPRIRTTEDYLEAEAKAEAAAKAAAKKPDDFLG